MNSTVFSVFTNPVYASAVIAAFVLILAAAALLTFRRDILSDRLLKKSPDKEGIENVYEAIISENEIKANRFIACIEALIAFFSLMQWALGSTGFGQISVDVVTSVLFSVVFTVTTLSAFVIFLKNGESRNLKCYSASAIVIVCFLISVYTVNSYWVTMLIPVIVSVRYFDSRYTVKNTVLCVIGEILSRIAALFVGISSGTYAVSNISVPTGKSFVFGDSIIDTLIESGTLSFDELVRIEVYNILLCSILIVGVGLIIVSVAKYGRKMIYDSALFAYEKSEAEKEVNNAKTKIMMSQLQPHFLYNSLSAIMAIDGNSPETVEALADFSKYLRGNLDSLKCDSLIPFSAELEHIEHYTALEQLRFGERVKIVYDITTKDFKVPPLCVQMAMENAIKHGITQKPEGGTVTLTTEERPYDILITVEDDGVGFDTSVDYSQQGSHVGVNSAKERIKILAGGSVNITSAVGVGTKVEILLPKEDFEI